jgi:hypothetical protein
LTAPLPLPLLLVCIQVAAVEALQAHPEGAFTPTLPEPAPEPKEALGVERV